MTKKIVQTEKAPAAIGVYSQAVQAGQLLFISGQIPLVANSMEIVSDEFEAQAVQCFTNLKAVCEAAGTTMDNIVKVNISMTDLSNFSMVNTVMSRFFKPPYPARAAVGVAQLPKNALIEIEAIVDLS